MRLCLIAALALLGIQPVLAQDAKPSEESVKHLFEVMHSKHLIEEVLGSMDGAMRASFDQGTHGMKLNAEQQKIRDEMLTKLVSIMKEELTWSGFEPLMIQAYQNAFTQQDVDALTNFYSSPAGQAVADKLPRATEQTMQLMQQRVREMMPRIQELARDTAERIRKAADSPAAQPPPTH